MKLLRHVTRRMALFLPFLLCFLASTTTAYGVIVGPWSMSGPGTTTVDVDGNTSALTYALAPAGFEVRTWTATANVFDAGPDQFDWSDFGSHTTTQVTAFLNTTNPSGTLVDEGPVDCCIQPSVGFRFSGSDSFLVTEGEMIGFSFAGSKVDADNTLIGSLVVASVPVPPALWMLVLALTLMAFIAHRGQQRAH